MLCSRTENKRRADITEFYCRRLFAQDWKATTAWYDRMLCCTLCSVGSIVLSWRAQAGGQDLITPTTSTCEYTNGASECTLINRLCCHGDREHELQRGRHTHWLTGTADAAALDTSESEAPGTFPFATMRSVPCDAMQARCWHKVKAEGNLNLVFDTACQAVGRSAAPPGPQIELAHNSGHHLTPSEPSQAQAFDNKLYA